MKKALVLSAVLALTTVAPGFARADGTALPSLACVTGTFNAQGTITMVNASATNIGGPEVVIVQSSGAVQGYTLKDDFALYHPMYNLKSPFNTALLNLNGAAGTSVVTGTALTATWVISDDKTTTLTAVLTADYSTGRGHLALTGKRDADGSFASSFENDVVCSTAGLK